MTPLAPHITAFLRQRLPVERAASPHTCDTYAYAFRLLFAFASRQLGVPPSALHLEHLDAPLVLAFLEDLQTARGNGPRTRNARLIAIKSFMHFVEHRVPGALEQIQRLLAIPAQKADRRLVEHLTAAQCQPLLDAPDPTTRAGIRDRAMLHVCVTAGVRVSELVGLRLIDVTFPPATSTSISVAKAAKIGPSPSGPPSPTPCGRGWPSGATPPCPNCSSTPAAGR